MRVLKVVAAALAALGVLLLVVSLVAGFGDGPLGPFPGGAMSGPVAAAPPSDWSGVPATVELEIRPEQPWSLRTYAIPLRGELYVPSFHAARRRWVPVALADPRVRVRVDGRLYERRLERVTDPSLRAALAAAMADRHGYAPDGIVASEATWYFRLAPRRRGGLEPAAIPLSRTAGGRGPG